MQKKWQVTINNLKQICHRYHVGVHIKRDNTPKFCPGCGRHMDSFIYIHPKKALRNNRSDNAVGHQPFYYLCDNCILDLYLKLGDILEIDTITGTGGDLSPKGFVSWPGGNQQIYEYMLKGQKIHAIKHYRELTGKGLKESKQIIDKLQIKMGDKYDSKSPRGQRF